MAANCVLLIGASKDASNLPWCANRTSASSAKGSLLLLCAVKGSAPCVLEAERSLGLFSTIRTHVAHPEPTQYVEMDQEEWPIVGQSQPAMATYLQRKIGGQLFSQLLQMGEGSPSRQHAHHVQYEGSLGVT